MARAMAFTLLLVVGFGLASAQLVPPTAPGRADKYVGPDANTSPGAGNLRIHYLGTGNPGVWHEAVATGLLFQFGMPNAMMPKNVIIDLGTGAIVNLLSLGISYQFLDEMIISHLHSDHIGDLPTHYANGQARQKPLEIWGPSGPDYASGTYAMVEGVKAFQYWDQLTKARINPGKWGLGSAGGAVVVHQFDYAVPRQLIYNRSSIQIYSSPVFHYDTPGAVGLRIEFNGIKITYSGDCAPSDTLIDLALWRGGSNILMHEAVAPVSNWTALLPEQKHIFTNHTSALEVGELCSTIKPQLCAVNHLEMNAYSMVPIITQIRRTYSGPLIIAQDMTLIDVTPTTAVYRKFVAPHRSWSYQFSNAVFNIYNWTDQPSPTVNEAFLLGTVTGPNAAGNNDIPNAQLSQTQIGIGLGAQGVGNPIPSYMAPSGSLGQVAPTTTDMPATRTTGS